ncbi:MAG TPA: Phenylacetic acid catabolic protein [Thermoanaerobaculia bacterium]|nr:Phenylacetic acid catabolic protein [Thermoanaerobaculia bacterium]
MSVRTAQLPHKFHAAVEKWRDTYLPDYDFLMENWEKHFPNEPRFELCAFRELGMCTEIECGEWKGKPKYQHASQMHPEQAHHLLSAIKAQASTEFGSIQQHRLTLARAQNEEEQFWILRMMAEELRHGYQMLHLLAEDDWSSVSQESGTEMVESILSMNTGSHILGAFNVDFDSFVDNVVFCGLIDRVGKYQLSMQKISAYQPMAESMPKMLREEAFHLAAGVVPMRRWVQSAAKGDVYVTMEMLQRAFNKWLPRGLEMFGDERGGGTNVRYGLKPMKNSEAQRLYYEEVSKVVRDLNMRYLRARIPGLDRAQAETLLDQILADRETRQGVRFEDLLRLPHPDYFRRRGVSAFKMVGAEGETYTDFSLYLRHLAATLPESYLANRDFRDYAETLGQVARGEIDIAAASGRMPALRRVGGACTCSKSVRWVYDDPLASTSGAPAELAAAGHPAA